MRLEVKRSPRCLRKKVDFVSFQLRTRENDHGHLKGQLFRRRPTTGNSNMAAKTGSTYISESMTDIIKIPTANSRRVSPHGFNNGNGCRTGNTYTAGTMTDGIEIPTTNSGFSTTRVRQKCCQVTATRTDSPNSKICTKTSILLYSGCRSFLRPCR